MIVRFCGLVVGEAWRSATLRKISKRASSTVVEVIAPGANAAIVFYIHEFFLS